ncbi:MAG TPA: hypothetical protein VH518_19610, partial [Tepidisphaeraceae bacterium]
MEQYESQFEDPELKAALQRALGGESASSALRARVAAAIEAEQQKALRIRPAWVRPLAGLAAAAVLLIGFVFAYSLLFSRDHTVPQWFAMAMVKTHDGSAHPSADLAGDDFSAIGTKLRSQLGYPILSAPLGNDWKFQGAELTDVGSTKAAHLVFTRGDQTVSIFSGIPVGVLYSKEATEGMSYAQMENGHPVSGFVHAGAIHCLVGSSRDGSLDLKTLT